ncbi:UDP-N-acetylmuramoyl-L-alanine--D-glutamate ligase [Alteromonas sp. AMM-1]|uniref:UDP-N-acetylmuramoyl-L-alanine--D-glutamate ligase n=1 Tax=Alteromonas sp. AMM-1 TaxID=3394233 RepID=UPI0039A73202
MNNLLNNATHFVVAGSGLSGLSCVRYLLDQGKQVKLWDTRPHAHIPDTLTIDVVCGELPDNYWQGMEVLVVSPGISPALPAIQNAAASGVQVVGDIELFAQAVQCPVIGITGSNGKTTVTLLTTHILQQLGINAIAAGNVGLPALDALSLKPEVAVLELSSFQLETTVSLNLHAATLLNVSADHLDRHGTLDAYRAAKQRIFFHARCAAVNRDDNETLPTDSAIPVIQTGLTECSTGFGWRGETQTILYNGQPILRMVDTQLVGLHNALNIQASLALVSVLNVDVEQAAQAVKTFKPAPHRCAKIAVKGGVTYIDDSKATNIGATEAALIGLGPTLAGRLILIAGGDAKGADLTALKPLFDKHVNAVIAMGRDGKVLSDIAANGHYVATMPEAVALAASMAQPGDTVLLSPACASLDMFKNYQHRAEVFANAIQELPA